MHSTPSRSKARTRISRPAIGWPISAFGAAFFFVRIFVFITSSGWRVPGRKKTTAATSRGVVQKPDAKRDKPLRRGRLQRRLRPAVGLAEHDLTWRNNKGAAAAGQAVIWPVQKVRPGWSGWKT